MPFAMGGHYPVDRREFFLAGAFSFFGTNLATSAAYAVDSTAPAGRKKAKSAIMIWLSGGASHIDTWDLKPNAPAECATRLACHAGLR